MPSRRSARRRRWVRGIVSPCVRRVAWRTISISMRGILRPLPSKEPHRETIEKIQKVSRERTYSDGRLHELVKREGIILHENAKFPKQEDHPMWPQEFTWFFAIFHHEFRKGNLIAFEVLMMLAFAHLFGFYNPKQLADFLGIPHQKFYAELKNWSVYHLKKMLVRFMMKQAVEHLKPVLQKSAATQSRAGMTLSIDHSVIDRFGKLLRCTWSWFSGRHHDVVRGQDLLGIVLTINHIAFPLHLLFCPKQGRYNTNKTDLLIFMLSRLKTAFALEGIDMTNIPLTMDSWFVSQPLRTRLHH